MDKTVCELFAGVGGFRCGLNHIKTVDDLKRKEEWETVWFSQWEPMEKRTQYAHDCYVYRFGKRLDKDGKDTTNINIENVDKKMIPDFNLLVGGFPCQDYSVAATLSNSKGIEGKKGVLWWSVFETITVKRPPFILLENVDRLLKSPAKQRGRDFGIILSCLLKEGYTVEWRVINAAEYGYQQRRRRTFIFAYKNQTRYCKKMNQFSEKEILIKNGFFAKTFKVKDTENQPDTKELSCNPKEVSDLFTYNFKNCGMMKNGIIYTMDVLPEYKGNRVTLGDIMETDNVDKKYFVPENKVYYTTHDVTHSNEINARLSKGERQTWQYIKGAKKIPRTSSNGHEYVFTEGAVPLIDSYDKPARTMLTSEGSFNRSTHLVIDKVTGNIRLLTPEETERIQGFPPTHTKYCMNDGEIIEIPDNKRRFMMGNALVVNLIQDMETTLTEIFNEE